jgi:hypothetical protein
MDKTKRKNTGEVGYKLGVINGNQNEFYASSVTGLILTPNL